MNVAYIGSRRDCERAVNRGVVWDGTREVPVRLAGTPLYRRAGADWRVDFEVAPR